MKENKIKQITILSAFIALACILSMLDRTLSKLIIVLLPYVGALAPSLKLGIANIVIIIIIYKYDFKWSLLAVVLKCLIAGLLYSGLINFVIGITGTLLSFFITILLKHVIKKEVFIPFISVVASIVHMLGQISAASLIYQTTEMWIYSPFLFLTAATSGVIVGLISLGVLKLLFLKKGDMENE